MLSRCPLACQFISASAFIHVPLPWKCACPSQPLSCVPRELGVVEWPGWASHAHVTSLALPESRGKVRLKTFREGQLFMSPFNLIVKGEEMDVCPLPCPSLPLPSLHFPPSSLLSPSLSLLLFKMHHSFIIYIGCFRVQLQPKVITPCVFHPFFTCGFIVLVTPTHRHGCQHSPRQQTATPISLSLLVQSRLFLSRFSYLVTRCRRLCFSFLFLHGSFGGEL